MAADRLDNEGSEPKRGENEVKNAFKCCRDKSTSVIVCVNCGGLFHRSCFKRKQCLMGDDPRVQCCSKETSVGAEMTPQADVLEQISPGNVTEKLRMENEFLIKLLQKSEENNRLLEDNIKLLYENKKMLEEKLVLSLNTDNKTGKQSIYQTDSNSATKAKYSDKVQQKNSLSKISKQTAVTAVTSKQTIYGKQTIQMSGQGDRSGDKTTDMKNTVENIDVKHLENMQRRKMTELVSLGMDSLQNEKENHNEFPQEKTVSKDNDVWHEQRRKTRNYRKKTLGQNEEEDVEFEGIKPRVWMYIYRVQNNVTEKAIENYLNRKLKTKSNEKLIVKDLQTKGNNKCFMVAADIKYKDEFYSPDFWPKGVGYKRFDFKLHNKYRETRGETSPLNFTEVTKRGDQI